MLAAAAKARARPRCLAIAPRIQLRGYAETANETPSSELENASAQEAVADVSDVASAPSRRTRPPWIAYTMDDVRTFAFDDMPSIHQEMIEEGREMRRFLRKTKFELPELTKFVKEFVPPTPDQCIQIRLQHYQGEEHPVSRKAVASISVSAVAKAENLDSKQVQRLILLAGPRYKNDTIKISCEDFPHRAQNMKFISDTIKKLLTSAREGGEWDDLPIPKRKAAKKSYPFPKAWLQKTEPPKV